MTDVYRRGGSSVERFTARDATSHLSLYRGMTSPLNKRLEVPYQNWKLRNRFNLGTVRRAQGEVETMQLMNGRFGQFCVVAIAALIAGCAGGASDDLPDLEPVTGKITLDGKPLANVHVKFEPQSKGAASNGVTDADGKFELTYLGDKKGAAVGSHIVRIVVANEADATENIPVKYNTQSELKATVEKGKPNEINFDLTK